MIQNMTVTEEDVSKFSDLPLLAALLEHLIPELGECYPLIEIRAQQTVDLIRLAETDAFCSAGTKSQMEEDWMTFQRDATGSLVRTIGGRR